MGWGASLACPQNSAVSENFTNLAENSSAASLAALTSLWYPESNVVARDKLPNPAAYSLSLESQQQNIAADKGLNLSQFPSPPVPPIHDKKSFTPCRYQQDKLDATFFGFGASIMPTSETAGSALGRQYHAALSPYSSTTHHESSITNGHHVLTSVPSGVHAQSSALVATTASAVAQHQTTSSTANSAMNNTGLLNSNTNSGNTNGSLFGSHHFTNGQYHSIHDTTGRSCALPSPTIYPPTPPPSAPWIHPWFVGDTF